MAKQAKIPQTEWTRSGMDISRTATPYYQSALSSLGNITNDPNAYRQQLREQYYGPNSAYNQDSLRQYNRAMGNATANNYAATAGGLSSSAQRAYNDQQRYYNDLQSRLLDYGVQGANSLMSTDVNALNSALGSFNSAYNLGSNYSKIDQQNQLADKANKQWWASIPGLVGGAIGSAVGGYFGGPAGAMVGSSLGTSAGNTAVSPFVTDYSSLLGGSSGEYQNMSNAANESGLFSSLGNLFNTSRINKAAGSTGAAQNVGFAKF